MKIFFIYILLFSSLISFSQPNGGFEDWETEFGQESPVGWQTANFLCAFPPNSPSAIKVSGLDKHSGNYALKIKSVEVVNNPMPGILDDDTLGFAFTGNLNLSRVYFNRGFPYNGRPEKVSVWYKYLPVGNDVGTFGAVLTKWNGLKQDTIAIADSVLSFNPIYSFLELRLNYLLEEFPDSAAILVASSRWIGVARLNSALFVDDVEFTGWVGMNDYDTKESVTLYPNPARDELHFKLNSNEKLKINILEASGKIQESILVNNANMSVDVKNYSSGIYFYEIMDEKNSTITRGKFTVVK